MGAIQEMLPILIPLLVIELGLRVFALISVLKAKSKGIELRFDPILWVVIVAVVNFGWLVYFIFGRKDQ